MRRRGRKRRCRDPDFVDVPVGTLIGESWAAERGKAIDPHRASPGMPLPGAVCAVRQDLTTGELEGAADPRRWSRAMGW